MGKPDSEKSSTQKMTILELLYVNRGATAKQLLCFLYPEDCSYQYVNNPSTQISKHTKMKNLHKFLSNLRNDGLIEGEPFRFGSRIINLYVLTREGLNFIKGHLQIEFEYQGSGFGQDYGDFTYELYRPAQSQKNHILHHLLLIDFFSNVNEYLVKNSIIPGTIEYRDNRYSSAEYVVKSKKYKHRPDAELLIENRLYWIEIDRSTEYSGLLDEKFENYGRYIDHLSQNGKDLPAGIIFITDIKKDTGGSYRRWNTLCKMFNKQLGRYSNMINLIYGDLSEVQKILTQEFVAEAMIEKRLKPYTKFYLGKDNFIDLNQLHGLSSSNMLCTITKHDTHDQLFVFERVNCFETKGVARLLKLVDYLQNEKQLPNSLKKVKEVIPVFYQHINEAKPLPVDLNMIPSSKKNPIHVQEPVWINIFGDHPIWMTNSGSQIQVKNPLQMMEPKISFSNETPSMTLR